MQALANFGWVFLGGGIGSALRYGVGRAALALVGPDYPAGTLAVNVIGCVAMGVLIEWLALREPASTRRPSLPTTGVLGGFTTFSAFALDAAVLGSAARRPRPCCTSWHPSCSPSRDSSAAWRSCAPRER
jgi:CrcB protein